MVYICRFFAVLIFITSGLSSAEAERQSGGLEVSSQLNLPDGTLKNCATHTAYAIPVSKKSTRTMRQFYSSAENGFVTIYATPELIWSDLGYDLADLKVTQSHRVFQTKFLNTKRVKCNESGVASFENLKAKEYYVIIPIFWRDSSRPRGTEYITPRKNRASSRGVYLRTPTNYSGGTLMAKIKVLGGENQNISFVGNLD